MTIDGEKDETPHLAAVEAEAEAGLPRPGIDVPGVEAAVPNRGEFAVAAVVALSRGEVTAPSLARVEVILASEVEDGWNDDTLLKVDQVATTRMMIVVPVASAIETIIRIQVLCFSENRLLFSSPLAQMSYYALPTGHGNL